MDNVNINVSILFKQRIIPGVYQFDVVVSDLPDAGSVVGTIIHSLKKEVITVVPNLEYKKEELLKMSFEVYMQLKEVFGD